MDSQLLSKLSERRNPNLLNNRENLQNEPVPSQMKQQAQKKPLKVLRVSQVNAAVSAIMNITPGAVGQQQQVLPINSLLADNGAKSGKAGPIRLPSKARRTIRIAKKKLLPTPASEQTQGAEAPEQQSMQFNPYDQAGADPVSLPQQWQPSEIKSKNVAAPPLVKRPSTPDEQKKQCLDCGNTKDFIFGLQREVKRLQDLANEFNLQIILAGGTPEENFQIDAPLPQQKPTGKQGQDTATPGEQSDEVKLICPECPTTQRRQQAKLKRQAAELASSQMPAETSRGGGGGGAGQGAQMRVHTHCLFPRNNLIDGAPQETVGSPALKPMTPSNQENRAVRICQLKDMRRQAAAFAQEQQDFVGKLTSQQQAVRLPGVNADQIKEMVQATAYGSIQAAPPSRIGSSNLAFRKKKASSIIQLLPPLSNKAQQQAPQAIQRFVMNFQPQPMHIQKEDSDDAAPTQN